MPKRHGKLDTDQHVETPQQSEVEVVRVSGQHSLLDGAREVPGEKWAVTIDGFSHLFHDLNCRLWNQPIGGEPFLLAEDVPLGQVYFDEKGSERCAVQIALNRSGTVYSDFR